MTLVAVVRCETKVGINAVLSEYNNVTVAKANCRTRIYTLFLSTVRLGN